MGICIATHNHACCTCCALLPFCAFPSCAFTIALLVIYCHLQCSQFKIPVWCYMLTSLAEQHCCVSYRYCLLTRCMLLQHVTMQRFAVLLLHLSHEHPVNIPGYGEFTAGVQLVCLASWHWRLYWANLPCDLGCMMLSQHAAFVQQCVHLAQRISNNAIFCTCIADNMIVMTCNIKCNHLTSVVCPLQNCHCSHAPLPQDLIRHKSMTARVIRLGC